MTMIAKMMKILLFDKNDRSDDDGEDDDSDDDDDSDSDDDSDDYDIKDDSRPSHLFLALSDSLMIMI